jgi:hypothetical protein
VISVCLSNCARLKKMSNPVQELGVQVTQQDWTGSWGPQERQTSHGKADPCITRGPSPTPVLTLWALSPPEVTLLPVFALASDCEPSILHALSSLQPASLRCLSGTGDGPSWMWDLLRLL